MALYGGNRFQQRMTEDLEEALRQITKLPDTDRDSPSEPQTSVPVQLVCTSAVMALLALPVFYTSSYYYKETGYTDEILKLKVGLDNFQTAIQTIVEEKAAVENIWTKYWEAYATSNFTIGPVNSNRDSLHLDQDASSPSPYTHIADGVPNFDTYLRKYVENASELGDILKRTDNVFHTLQPWRKGLHKPLYQDQQETDTDRLMALKDRFTRAREGEIVLEYDEITKQLKAWLTLPSNLRDDNWPFKISEVLYFNLRQIQTWTEAYKTYASLLLNSSLTTRDDYFNFYLDEARKVVQSTLINPFIWSLADTQWCEHQRAICLPLEDGLECNLKSQSQGMIRQEAVILRACRGTSFLSKPILNETQHSTVKSNMTATAHKMACEMTSTVKSHCERGHNSFEQELKVLGSLDLFHEVFMRSFSALHGTTLLLRYTIPEPAALHEFEDSLNSAIETVLSNLKYDAMSQQRRALLFAHGSIVAYVVAVIISLPTLFFLTLRRSRWLRILAKADRKLQESLSARLENVNRIFLRIVPKSLLDFARKAHTTRRRPTILFRKQETYQDKIKKDKATSSPSKDNKDDLQKHNRQEETHNIRRRENRIQKSEGAFGRDVTSQVSGNRKISKKRKLSKRYSRDAGRINIKERRRHDDTDTDSPANSHPRGTASSRTTYKNSGAQSFRQVHNYTDKGKSLKGEKNNRGIKRKMVIPVNEASSVNRCLELEFNEKHRCSVDRYLAALKEPLEAKKMEASTDIELVAFEGKNVARPNAVPPALVSVLLEACEDDSQSQPSIRKVFVQPADFTCDLTSNARSANACDDTHSTPASLMPSSTPNGSSQKRGACSSPSLILNSPKELSFACQPPQTGSFRIQSASMKRNRLSPYHSYASPQSLSPTHGLSRSSPHQNRQSLSGSIRRTFSLNGHSFPSPESQSSYLGLYSSYSASQSPLPDHHSSQLSFHVPSPGLLTPYPKGPSSETCSPSESLQVSSLSLSPCLRPSSKPNDYSLVQGPHKQGSRSSLNPWESPCTTPSPNIKDPRSLSPCLSPNTKPYNGSSEISLNLYNKNSGSTLFPSGSPHDSQSFYSNSPVGALGDQRSRIKTGVSISPINRAILTPSPYSSLRNISPYSTHSRPLTPYTQALTHRHKSSLSSANKHPLPSHVSPSLKYYDSYKPSSESPHVSKSRILNHETSRNKSTSTLSVPSVKRSSSVREGNLSHLESRSSADDRSSVSGAQSDLEQGSVISMSLQPVSEVPHLKQLCALSITVPEMEAVLKQANHKEFFTILTHLTSMLNDRIQEYDVFIVEQSGFTTVIGAGTQDDDLTWSLQQVCSLSLDLMSSCGDIEIDFTCDRKIRPKIGIHAGPCVGFIPSTKDIRCRVVGNVVHHARQHMTAAFPNSILVSAWTCDLLKSTHAPFELIRRDFQSDSDPNFLQRSRFLSGHIAARTVREESLFSPKQLVTRPRYSCHSNDVFGQKLPRPRY